ncbi:unnamed protein product [Cladocopium goreaui]|uniref:Uncharacterized protein n=1 Tax=Cladocopium goreaui TaxID=2562237 RepID=A0A9P1DLB1_9DINO|nr:unnamed protein product [Cladocopium goreaui]
MFLKYCEQCAYDAKTSLKSNVVGQYLEMGADVCGRKNGASALLLRLGATPKLAERQGGGLSRGLWSLLFEGQENWRLHRTGQIVNAPLRFLEGDRVLCRVEAPGNLTTWEEGVVVGLWYKEKDWPPQFQGAPYEVKLDIGSHVYALVDHSGLIQREAREKPATLGASGYGNGNGNANAKPQGRFQKRQREDGSWELLDTKSGKARACSPPDSDEDAPLLPYCYHLLPLPPLIKRGYIM